MAQSIKVDIKPGLFQPTLHFSQGDIGREFAIKIVTNDGFSVPVGATVDLVGTKPSGFGFTVPCTVSGNTVSFTSSNTDGEVFTDEHGIFPAELVIKSNGDVIGTANFFFSGEKNPHPAETIDGEAEQIIPELTLLVERVEAAASSVLDMQVVATTLPAGSDATYSYDEDTNTATFGIPKGADGSLASGVLAPTYSSSATYAVGDYVYYSGDLYRCVTAITTAEAWTAGHWEQVALANDVSDAKEDLYDYFKVGKNIFFGEFENAGIATANGTWVTAGINQRYTACKSFIPVETSTQYVLSCKSMPVLSTQTNVFEYDSSKQFIKYTNVGTFGTGYNPTITVGATTAFIRISMYGQSTAATYTDVVPINFQIEKGSSPTMYEPNRILNFSHVDPIEFAGEVTSTLESDYKMCLLNIDTLDGYYGSDGSIEPPDSTRLEKTTEKIALNGTTKFYLKINYEANVSTWIGYALFDSKGKFISREVYYNDSANNYSALITISNNQAKYVAFSLRTFGKLFYFYSDVFGYQNAQSIRDLRSSIGNSGVLLANNLNLTSSIKGINHRGYNTIAPENTLPAFKLSKEKGFLYVECDVAFTSDNVPVILHDATINRTARNEDGTTISGTVYIKDITYEEALEYDFGIWKDASYAGTKIPTLSEFITLCKDIALKPYIEIKTDDTYTQAQINILVDTVKSAAMLNDTTWISEQLLYLQYVQDAFPNARLGYIATRPTAEKIANAVSLKTSNNDVFADMYTFTDAEIDACVEADLPLEAWTVNTAQDVINMNKYVTGITSDSLHAPTIIYNYAMSE